MSLADELSAAAWHGDGKTLADKLAKVRALEAEHAEAVALLRRDSIEGTAWFDARDAFLARVEARAKAGG